MNNNALKNQPNSGRGEGGELGVKALSVKMKRLNLALDEGTFMKLDRIKVAHGDASYTQAIKRAIALLEFIDQKKEEGLELFIGDEKKSKLMHVISL